MASITQTDFSGGMFRGRRAPRNTAFDIVNGLISDEGEVFRRGGSEYKSGSDADDTLLGLWDGHTTAGRRTLLWSDSTLYVLDSDDESLVTLTPPTVTGVAYDCPNPNAVGVEIGGLVFFPSARVASGGGSEEGSETEIVYAGSRKAAYSTGNAATTFGSAVVTGSGTSWLANVDPGMILRRDTSLSPLGIVKSVESDTSLTLTRPAPATVASGTYTLIPVYQQIIYGSSGGNAHIANSPTTFTHAVAGQRLIRAFDNRAFFSRTVADDNFIADGSTAPYGVQIADRTTDYHELPRAALITGADSIQDTLLLFTTEGVWAVGNMALDAVDAFGNIQHQVQQISQQVILWGEPGIAARENVLIVPAIDDVYAFALGATPVPLSQGIRPLYREYVEAGYKPGLATTYRGHYILPILESDNTVHDTLVCRLDRGPAWTRWANGASGRAYARRVGSTTREPKLLGLDGLRVSELTGVFDPDSSRKDDADGTDHALEVTTSDYPLAEGVQKGHVLKVRAVYSLVDAASDDPGTTMQWSRGPEGSSFTTLTNLPSTSPFHAGERDGTGYASWTVGKAAEYMRFKWSTTGAAASATLRKIELLVRPSGKQ